MLLEGSCHCEAVTFKLESHTPYPFMRCYCSICRKTAGGGGYAINIMGGAKSFELAGKEHVTRFHARVTDKDGKKKASSAWRHFCAKCGSALWVSDAEWPDWIYPFASAIDTPLPKPPEEVEMMLNYAAPWAHVPSGRTHAHFDEYPQESIADWHKSRGLEQP
jgi:hypothetical protein